jgi:hypothetical protein
MKMEQQQVQTERMRAMSYITRFYLFLRDRDAIIIELFFLALNVYFLALIILPPYAYTGTGLIIRGAFQLMIVIVNVIALVQANKYIRILSALLNAMIMSFISFALINSDNVHAGTYILLAVLAVFACWKITAR